MGAYIYTPRTKTLVIADGRELALLGYAYKDFYDYGAPARWIRTAAVQEAAGQRAADKHNENGVKYLAKGDKKFEIGLPIYEVGVEWGMRNYYVDDIMGKGSSVHVGFLDKKGKEWVIVDKDPIEVKGSQL